MLPIKEAFITLGYITLFSISLGISLRLISKEILFSIQARREVSEWYANVSYAFLLLPLAATVIDVTIMAYNCIWWWSGRYQKDLTNLLLFLFQEYDFNLACVVVMTALNLVYLVTIAFWNIPLNRFLKKRQDAVLAKFEANMLEDDEKKSKFIHYF